jgi:hypothetical protein
MDQSPTPTFYNFNFHDSMDPLLAAFSMLSSSSQAFIHLSINQSQVQFMLDLLSYCNNILLIEICPHHFNYCLPLLILDNLEE